LPISVTVVLALVFAAIGAAYVAVRPAEKVAANEADVRQDATITT
jgi:hypothetical protein